MVAMRAVVLDDAGRPAIAQIAEPSGPGRLVRVLACGLCGSDVEKLGRAPAGTVLGHEVVAEDESGQRVVLVHHLPCGVCERCLSGHESTCDAFRAETIEPGGFAERARARATVDVPDGVPDALGTYAEPLACVLRGAERVPTGRVLIVGNGFIGRLFGAVLARRGDEVFVTDIDPRREGRPPDGPVDAAVVCASAGADEAARAVVPGGTVLVFADAGLVDLRPVYRSELTVVGSRSATPRHVRDAASLLTELELPEPTVLPLERFAEGLALYRARDVLKVVFHP
jgi:L-iditol 2-dehydrogenase